MKINNKEYKLSFSLYHVCIYSVFTENEAQRGILGIAYLPVKFSGTVRFESNIGQAIRVSLKNIYLMVS